MGAAKIPLDFRLFAIWIVLSACTLEHVIFAGFTHEPAVSLAEKIIHLLGHPFGKVFYSDNGATAVEIGLKMAYQYWHNQGQKNRTRFIAFENAYHGDTFGSMSVGKSCGFYNAFEPFLFDVDIFSYPSTYLDDQTILERETKVLTALANHLQQYAKDTAAIIIEPLIQGVAGMQICRPEFLQALQKLARDNDVLVIYDEVMTGFYRTGLFFNVFDIH
jgi:adenosylmethionine-8-amino-7-oxononanoate aminotransferase